MPTTQTITKMEVGEYRVEEITNGIKHIVIVNKKVLKETIEILKHQEANSIGKLANAQALLVKINKLQ